MRVLVTGGSGFIGRRLVHMLHQRGDDVVVLSRRDVCVVPPGVAVQQGDLTFPCTALEPIIEGCELIFHCAGELRDKNLMARLHIDGTHRLLEAASTEAARRGRPMHWVQLSSVGAYGDPPSGAGADRVVTEETPNRPMNEYELTKTRSDDLVVHASQTGLLTYSIVRPSNVFAADMPNQSLRAMAAMVRKGFFFYIGRPGAVATYVHVDDVIEVLRRCGSDDRAKGQVFNVSNDCLLEEMVGGIASALRVARPRLRLPEPLVRSMVTLSGLVMRTPLTHERINALVRRTWYPHAKLQRVLSFSPQRSVPDTIGEIL